MCCFHVSPVTHSWCPQGTGVLQHEAAWAKALSLMIYSLPGPVDGQG